MSLRWRKAATRSSPRRGSSDSDRPWDPEQCVKLLAGNTDLTRLTIVKRELAHASSSWMNRFLELDGLEALFRALDTYSAQTSFQDAVLQLHCVECLRALMNGRTGLDHIVGQPRYTRKLAEALASSNRVVRKQVLELLSAVCVYAPGGQALALDALDHLRASAGKAHRFSVLLEELSHPEVLTFAATVLAFINCLIISTEDFRERLHLRNQLLGLGFLELVDPLRRAGDDELFIQCHVFETTREADDEHALSLGLTASGNHYEAFGAVMNKVYGKPQSIAFLMLLRNLEKLDPEDPASWPQPPPTQQPGLGAPGAAVPAAVLRARAAPLQRAWPQAEPRAARAGRGHGAARAPRAQGEPQWQRLLLRRRPERGRRRGLRPALPAGQEQAQLLQAHLAGVRPVSVHVVQVQVLAAASAQPELLPAVLTPGAESEVDLRGGRRGPLPQHHARQQAKRGGGGGPDDHHAAFFPALNAAHALVGAALVDGDRSLQDSGRRCGVQDLARSSPPEGFGCDRHEATTADWVRLRAHHRAPGIQRAAGAREISTGGGK